MAAKVLVVGSGGREHALAWKLAQSPQVSAVYVAPGNAGTSAIAQNVSLDVTEMRKLANFAEQNDINLTIIGPDDPLAYGIVDMFRARGLRIFGPTRASAYLESSKAFAKQLMHEQDIPTAPYRVFRDYAAASAYIRECTLPLVIKASGLAGGKGVYPCPTLAEAEQALTDIMVRHIYGQAGGKVIVESFLSGQELSVHAICDGVNAALFPPAQDHKPIFDGNRGPNTGGMGAIAPVPDVSPELMRNVQRLVIVPVLDVMRRRETPFVGCLYPGLMRENGSTFKVLEFNVRFGDPEAQAYMRLLQSDLYELLAAAADGALGSQQLAWQSGFAVSIALVSAGYPGSAIATGIPISGVAEAERLSDVVIFHGGTVLTDKLRTNGGRVLHVTATGATLEEALERGYRAVRLISFEGMHYRTDIGAQALARMR